MKHIDVRFNIFRWAIFFGALFLGWLLFNLLWKTRIYRIVGGAIGGLVAYFYFYFKDKK